MVHHPNWPPPPIEIRLLNGKHRNKNHPGAELDFSGEDVNEEQEEILKRKISTLWHQTKMDYMDFRDMWLMQNGCCNNCFKELNFWDISKHNYRVHDNSIYCYSCWHKVK